MKIYFDTNVFIAEALLGQAAEEMVAATHEASWRVYASRYLLDEIEKVLSQELGFSRRLAFLTKKRVMRRATLVEPGESRHAVVGDPKDSPILRAALHANVDYLVTNDRELLALNPYEGLRIVSMTDYFKLLVAEGLIRPAP